MSELIRGFNAYLLAPFLLLPWLLQWKGYWRCIIIIVSLTCNRVIVHWLLLWAKPVVFVRRGFVLLVRGWGGCRQFILGRISWNYFEPFLKIFSTYQQQRNTLANMLQERLIKLVLWDLVRHFKICKKVSATEQQCPTFHIAWTAWVSGVYYLPIQLTLTQPSIMEVVKIAMDIYLKDLSWKIWRYERKYAAPSLCILIWHPSVPPFAFGKTTASPFPDPWSLAASVAPGLESYHSHHQ